MNKKVFIYIPLYMFIYLIIVFIEIFLFKPFIDFFGNDFWHNFIVYNILLLLVNPILCYMLAEVVRIDFIGKDDTKGDLL